MGFATTQTTPKEAAAAAAHAAAETMADSAAEAAADMALRRQAGQAAHQDAKARRRSRFAASVSDLRAELRTSFFKPKTWAFWRTFIVACAFCSMLGHWLEMPYCGIMGSLFGIVEDDYAVLSDPWFVPYFVYGYGAAAMTLLLEPFKERILAHRKTLWGALLEMFLLTVLIAAVLETGFGLIINQPDAAGVYPFWDNSQLPLNILGQGWLVNDFFIGLAAMVYIWGIFPFFSILMKKLGSVRANVLFGICMAAYTVCCVITVFMFYI